MKTILTISCVLVFAILATKLQGSATEMIPGLRYIKGPENLNGRLIFLLRHDRHTKTYTEESASIYEYDFFKGKLRKLTACPVGFLCLSPDGKAFCIIRGHYDPPAQSQIMKSDVFVYDIASGWKRSFILPCESKSTVLIDGHIFFQVENSDYDKDTSATEIMDYNIATDQMHTIGLTNASLFQYQRYDHLHIPQYMTNVVHFEFRQYGNRLSKGRDYKKGVYSIFPATGKLRWVCDALEDMDNPKFTPKAGDGQFVFFEGTEGPLCGYTLVSAQFNIFEWKLFPSKRKEVKILHTFSKSVAGKSGVYYLHCISPCGGFALVRLVKMTWNRRWENIYYLVDLSTGNERVFLTDEVEAKTDGSIAAIQWVPAAK